MNKHNQLFVVLALTGVFFLSCTHDSFYLEPLDTSGLVTNEGTNTGGTAGSSTCDADTVYFENQVLPIFIGSCAATGCHDQASHEEGVVTVDYSSIKKGIVSGDPSKSKYYKVLITSDTEELMPRDPGTEKGTRLPDDQIALIKKWIEQGALNNSCDACDTTDYTFSGRIEPIFAISCATSTGCHAAGSTYGQFTSYDKIKPYIDSGNIYDKVITQKAMPPAGPLPDCDLDALAKWINDGAPNN
ncbi:MAG: hypothetical protein KDC79_06745 [Cyclobacteriaceae bacterium]|nr:hypothetical protein [Cyclobacteriaceae bacterium]